MTFHVIPEDTEGVNNVEPPKSLKVCLKNHLMSEDEFTSSKYFAGPCNHNVVPGVETVWKVSLTAELESQNYFKPR